ncbi:hypothetical protein [Yinghuangia soli]|uniref:Uncharacterized protein n=1 Tax=Yinghuangia soli TaxID=2908204 RepID=A0AA41U075_9ACTN|nr:hypothetical protein [Yinghuangia soli]MCF2529513.1 hypothetical protein [Yinghuangia soli]
MKISGTAARMSLALAGLVLVAGCGADSGGGSEGAAGNGAGAAAAQGSSGSGGGSGTGTPPKPGTDGLLTAPAGASESQQLEFAYANALAECMRKAGFTYTPYVSAPGPQDQDAERNPEAARKYREKYGFGAFAAAVYPGDPQVGGASTADQDPNSAAFAALPKDRQSAWNVALFGNAERSKMPGGKLGGCSGEAQVKVYGDEAERKARGDAAAEQSRISRQNLNGDAQLVGLAQQYATCLRGKGYPVDTTAVTEIRNALRFVWFAKAGELTPEPAPDKPGMKPQDAPVMDPAVARTHLPQEIRAALADLDCGKDFRAAYFPKADKLPGAEGLG